ncbi:16S rRNA (guanine(527)-N(7))-methyltransferase RsmG [Pendulispora albinea]|uniref:Ribosomal RNA small subunit methyltransferase G n=1 Tax=Pendulispora albinea TaxID=2741071 RepID=A0ABZ2LU94_9BACT
MSAHFSVSNAAEVDMRLGTWLDLLVTWNAKHDLTAARSEGELLDLMLADAYALSAHLPEGARVVDIGSGAGAPGLPLALIRPDLKVTLVEPLAKRVSFLRTVVGAVGRIDIQLHRGKAADVASSPTKWDIALSRATFSPAEWLACGKTLVDPDQGSIWVLLAREEPPVLEGVELRDTLTYEWPNQGRARRAVRYAPVKAA